MSSLRLRGEGIEFADRESVGSLEWQIQVFALDFGCIFYVNTGLLLFPVMKCTLAGIPPLSWIANCTGFNHGGLLLFQHGDDVTLLAGVVVVEFEVIQRNAGLRNIRTV